MKYFLLGVHVIVKTFNLKIFTLLQSVRLLQRILLKCVPHAQHDYFFSFIQSDDCFMASSLPLAVAVVVAKTPRCQYRFIRFSGNDEAVVELSSYSFDFKRDAREGTTWQKIFLTDCSRIRLWRNRASRLSFLRSRFDRCRIHFQSFRFRHDLCKTLHFTHPGDIVLVCGRCVRVSSAMWLFRWLLCRDM